MASFAAGERSVSTSLLHTLFKLSLVGVGVATDAVQIFPVIDCRRLGLELSRFLVTVRARNCNVAASQHEMRLLVPGKCKGRRFVALQIVAAIAGVQVRRRGKLSSVPVAVTIGAGRELDLEQSVFSLRNMTLRAFHPGVTSLQWICAGSMVLHGEGRRLPSVDVVA